LQPALRFLQSHRFYSPTKLEDRMKLLTAELRASLPPLYAQEKVPDPIVHEIVLDEMNLTIPVYQSWRLNPQHWGALEGLEKTKVSAIFGDEQARLWRRSYDVRPPSLTPDDQRYPGHDPRYKNLSPGDLPLTESLKDSIERFFPYWHETIKPAVAEGKRVLIVAHLATARALLRFLANASDVDACDLLIPSGVPFVWELDDAVGPVSFRPLAL
jgi:2,3-bisphosphoglycerate-dependent phosphoglycerate mutase